MINKNNTIGSEHLNKLLTRAYDAEQGYALAAEQAENDALKDWFSSNSAQRKEFGHALKKHIVDLAVEPDKGASIAGKVHQAFMKLRSAVSSENDLALIAECRRGEEQAIADYADALENAELRSDAANTLKTQSEAADLRMTALDSIEKALLPVS